MAPRSTASKSRRRGGPTRDLLVQAAEELLLKGGPEGLTASRISHPAGIAQPNFYVYFENLEDCQKAAAERIAHRVRRSIASHRADSFPLTMEEVDLNISIKHYAAILKLPTTGGAPGSAFLKLRGDDSAIGEVMRDLVDQLRSDLVEDLWRLAEHHKVDKRARAEIEILAEINLASVLAASTAILDGRVKSVSKTARVLAVSTIAAVRAIIEDLSPAAKPARH